MFVKPTGILVLLLLRSSSSAVQKSIKNGTNRIVGGYKCPIRNVPFLVSLRYLNYPDHFCAGSLLSEFWILSALHCLQSRCSRSIEVIAGSSFALDPKKNLNKEALQFSIVAQCYFYPILDDIQFDIALAKLEKPIRQANKVAFVKLPFDLPDDNRSLVDICSNATVAGWGTQYASSVYDEPIVHPVPDYDPHLRCTQIPVISEDECNNRSDSIVLPSFICAYQEMTDACHGDSGGPLTCDGYQYGIVSYGFGCAYNQFPGVYTNVLFFKDFILSTMTSPLNLERSSSKALRVSVELVVISVVILVMELYKFIKIG